MQRQMAKMVCFGIYTVVHDDKAEVNPYKIFKSWHEDGHSHRRMIVRLTTLADCMMTLANIAEKENQ